jgi:hypothetical protein
MAGTQGVAPAIPSGADKAFRKQGHLHGPVWGGLWKGEPHAGLEGTNKNGVEEAALNPACSACCCADYRSTNCLATTRPVLPITATALKGAVPLQSRSTAKSHHTTTSQNHRRFVRREKTQEGGCLCLGEKQQRAEQKSGFE